MSHRHTESDRHGWKNLHNYIAVHDKCMDELRRYFVEDDDLKFDVISRDRMVLRGSAFCKGSLVLHIEKVLEINAARQLRGIQYRYQAMFDAPPIRQIFRYDNAHRYEGHPDAFHKHTFSDRTWKPDFPPAHIGREDWPTLMQVIEELYTWWIDHRNDRLICP